VYQADTATPFGSVTKENFDYVTEPYEVTTTAVSAVSSCIEICNRKVTRSMTLNTRYEISLLIQFDLITISRGGT
jgi:hypothetical protein